MSVLSLALALASGVYKYDMFCAKRCSVLTSGYNFQTFMMDLVHICFNDRYWLNDFISTFPVPTHDLEVKVTELDFHGKVLCSNLYMKTNSIQSLRGSIYFIFGIMISIGQTI